MPSKAHEEDCKLGSSDVNRAAINMLKKQLALANV